MTNGCQSIILSTELRNPNPYFVSQISSDQKMTSDIFGFFSSFWLYLPPNDASIHFKVYFFTNGYYDDHLKLENDFG